VFLGKDVVWFLFVAPKKKNDRPSSGGREKISILLYKNISGACASFFTQKSDKKHTECGIR